MPYLIEYKTKDGKIHTSPVFADGPERNAIELLSIGRPDIVEIRTIDVFTIKHKGKK